MLMNEQDFFRKLGNWDLVSVFAVAFEDQSFRDIVLTKNPENVVGLYSDSGSVVGFAMPRIDSGGQQRSGPLFVLPEHRNQGIATRFLTRLFAKEAVLTQQENVLMNAGRITNGRRLIDNDSYVYWS